MSANGEDANEATDGSPFSLLDAHAPPAPPSSPLAPSRRMWIGLGVLAVVALAIVLPIGRLRRSRPPAAALVTETSPRRSAEVQKDEALHSLDLAASLASAAGALAQIEALRRESPTPTAPAAPALAPVFPSKPADASKAPAASTFESPTACMETYLPEVELADHSLDFVCRETEMWRAERKAYPRIAPRGGAGALMWRDLGTSTLAALAVMRAGCCESAEPLLAVVPGLWCGILRDKLRAFGPTLEREPFEAFAETMACLDDRGVRFPERWKRPEDGAQRAAVRRFAERAWQRARQPPPPGDPSQ